MIRDTFDFAADAIAQAFGDEVVYNGATVRAVFGSGFERVQSGDIRISSRAPEIGVRLADLTLPPERGDQVQVRDRLMEVVTVQPDAEGVSALLRLKAVD